MTEKNHQYGKKKGDAGGIGTYIPTYKKDINKEDRFQNQVGAEKINQNLMEGQQIHHSHMNFEEEKKIAPQRDTIEKINLHASHHLLRAEQFVPEKLLSKENFDIIQNISQIFPINVTSFLGFETRLGEVENSADFAFAISGLGKDRYIFSNLFQTENVSKLLLKHPEWNQIAQFAEAWSDKHTILQKNIKCFWLEFDIPKNQTNLMIPSVFFGPKKQVFRTPEDCHWLIESALPILKGKQISNEITNYIIKALTRIPENGSLFQVGTMLSRENNSIRLFINKLTPYQIIPYLKDIGWGYDEKELDTLIHEIKNLADRFVISFDITKQGIGPKIGIELSYSGNKFNQEDRWDSLFEYLIKKGLCLQQKRDALKEFTYEKEEEAFSGGVMKPILSATDYQSDITESKVIRYINHIKLVYEYGKQTIAKAYPAVRLFETDEYQSTMMNKD